jgi:hypothetical protein
MVLFQTLLQSVREQNKVLARGQKVESHGDCAAFAQSDNARLLPA